MPSFEAFRETLAAIDLAPLETELVELDAQRARLDKAMEEVRAELAQAREAAAREWSPADRVAAAARAFLARENVSAAYRQQECAQRDVEALEAALRGLEAEKRALPSPREVRRQYVEPLLAETARAADEAIYHLIDKAIAVLGHAYADCEAVARATGDHVAERNARLLREMLAAVWLTEPDRATELHIADDLAAALKARADVLKAVDRSPFTTVPWPRRSGHVDAAGEQARLAMAGFASDERDAA